MTSAPAEAEKNINIAALNDRDIILPQNQVTILPVKYLRSAVRELNRKVIENMGTAIHKDTIIISGMKGIEADSAKSPSQILAEALPDIDRKNFAVIAGATFAREIFDRHNLSATLAASKVRAENLARKHFKIFYEMYHVMHNGKSPDACFRDILSHYNAEPKLSKFRESLEMLRYRLRR